MTYIDVTRLTDAIDPAELSASRAEMGDNAGKITWGNALEAAKEESLTIGDRDAVRDFFKGFGAWEPEEIAAWSDAELDALVLQFAAGDLRELQSLCPGDGLGDVDWQEAEKLSQQGTVSGCLFVSDDNRLLIYCGD